ncbi:hypothetical protein [Desulforhopalus sp. 52FAK]
MILILWMVSSATASTTDISAPVNTSDKVIFSTDDTPDTPLYHWMDLLYKDLFSRMGYSFELLSMPSRRANYEAESGLIAGQAKQVKTFQEKVHNQIRVPESLYTLKVIALTRRSHPIMYEGIKDWQDLLKFNPNVEYIQGYQTAKKYLNSLFKQTQISTAVTAESGFYKLKSAYTDVLIMTYLEALPYLNSDEFKHYIAPAGILAEMDVHPYVHKNFSYLIPQMAESLQEMKQEGVIKQYWCDAYNISGVSIYPH